MKKLVFVVLSLVFLSGTAQENPTAFSQKALNDTFVTLEEEPIDFSSILKKHEGKTILIDVWASWCKDCIIGMPKVHRLQKDFPEVAFVFLSLDKTVESWKKGIQRFQLEEGDHYLMSSGWKGDFGTFLNLNWIPRYMVVDQQGNIKLFNAIKADDTTLIKALQ